jgi:hypothetical protein
MNKEESYKKLFSILPEAEPSSSIVTAVLSRIQHARLVRARLHAILHGSLIIIAVIAFIPAIINLITSASRSGFSSYISLAMSDGGSMLNSWQAFALSIIETAPLLEIGIILGLLLVFANSLRRGTRYISSMRAHDIAFA